ncbi:MAG: hypothetical protein N4A65_06455 [Cohaesibacter sp.]|jgi:hypothetical protein|nr:hypothetical protein [Cohaesibacter sp.]
MTKLLVINSFGPMASTLLSGLSEKLGFTNIPVRKLGLHQYLLGQRDLQSGFMQMRLKQTMKEHAKLDLRGGVSVLDRQNQKPSALVSYDGVEEKIDALVAKNVQDLYSQCHQIYADAVVYKDINSHKNWLIELTTDIHRYDHKALYQAYQDHFDEVYMIHLHRPFISWINSLASQAFLHPQLANRIKFFPHMRYADYMLYEEAVAQMPGLNIEFDSLFDTPIETLADNIARETRTDAPSCTLNAQDYDLYGKIIPYEKAFTRFDDGIEFLSASTREYFLKLVTEEKIGSVPYSVNAWFRYLLDMYKFRTSSL